MTMLKDAVAEVCDNGVDSRPTDVALRCVTDDIDEFAASLTSVYYPAKVNLSAAPINQRQSWSRFGSSTSPSDEFGSATPSKSTPATSGAIT